MRSQRYAETWAPRPTSLGAGAVLGLIGAAAIVQYRARAAETAHPPRGQFLDCPSGRLHYLDRGAGRAVIFLHGNGTMAEDFAVSGLLDTAGGSGRAIAIDRPGFGYSERAWTRSWGAAAQAAFMLEAIDALKVTRPIIVAHSWSTMVAAEMALQRPGALAGLVFISGYYYPSARLDVALFSPPAIPILGDILRYTVGPIVGEALKPRMLAKMFAPQPIPQKFWDRFPHALMSRPSQIRAEAEDAAHMIGSANALEDRYAGLELPIAILAGGADEIVDAAQAERLHRTLPRSTFERVRGAGHMLHYSHPEKVMDAIKAMGASRTSETA